MKNPLKTQEKLKELEITYQKIYVFLGKAKFADFRWKIADVSRTPEVCHVIHIFFASSLGKV